MVARVVFMAVPILKFPAQVFHFIPWQIAALFPAEFVVFFEVQGVEVGCFDNDVRMQSPEVKSGGSHVVALADPADGFD